ncbi:MAG: hypothetical protein M9894_27400 [Planctomycetes bacterium]|nr:hypothetical protein [Planctomycetota bacterium]MCW8138454.1 hypothetical protein [Planctomycetota bacterium]
MKGEEERALVGAALRAPEVAGYVTIALEDEARFDNPSALLSIALAASLLHERGEGGIAAVLALLAEWRETERVGGLEELEALAASEGARVKAEELRARLAALPAVQDEATVRVAASMLEATFEVRD